jgi:hypothetical protein
VSPALLSPLGIIFGLAVSLIRRRSKSQALLCPVKIRDKAPRLHRLPVGRSIRSLVLSQRVSWRGRISFARALILALAPRSCSGPGGHSNLLLLWCRSAHGAVGVDHQRTVRANSGPPTSRPWRVVIGALRQAEQTFRVDVLGHPKLPISMSEQGC